MIYDKFTRAVDDICYKLDHDVYIPIDAIIPKDIVHNFGALKEDLKQFIEDTIFALRPDHLTPADILFLSYANDHDEFTLEDVASVNFVTIDYFSKAVKHLKKMGYDPYKLGLKRD